MQIQLMWNMKRFVTSVTIGATRTGTKGLKRACKQHQDNIQHIPYNEQLY